MGLKISVKDGGRLKVETWGGTDSKVAQGIYDNESEIRNEMRRRGKSSWRDNMDISSVSSFRTYNRGTQDKKYYEDD